MKFSLGILSYHLSLLHSSSSPIFRNSVLCSLTAQMVNVSKFYAKRVTYFISFNPHHGPMETGAIHTLTSQVRKLKQREVKGLSQIKELASDRKETLTRGPCLLSQPTAHPA